MRVIKRCLCSLDIRLGKKKIPKRPAPRLALNSCFSLHRASLKKQWGGEEKGRRVGIELPGNQDSPLDSGIADEMAREKKGRKKETITFVSPC